MTAARYVACVALLVVLSVTGLVTGPVLIGLALALGYIMEAVSTGPGR